LLSPIQCLKPLSLGGITTNISKDTQAIIQNDIKTLLSNKAYLNAKLDRVSLYFPIVETMVATEGISDDFKYLCIQESGLLPDVVSKPNAVGFGNSKKKLSLILG